MIKHLQSRLRPPWPRLLAAAGLCLSIAGCSESVEVAEPVPPDGKLTQCSDPRPESCAQSYEPVCATRDPAMESDWETYSNSCVACADSRVTAYRKGACKMP